MHGLSVIIARSSCDEAIQFFRARALDCFAALRNDGFIHFNPATPRAAPVSSRICIPVLARSTM